MKKPFHVVVTKKIPEAGTESLHTHPRIKIIGGKNEYSLSKKALMRRVRGADAIVSQLTDRIDGDVMDAAGPQLKLIANYAVGYDNIDIDAAKQRGIAVTNTPGGVSRAVAEHAWVLTLACAKQVVASDAFMRKGKYREWRATAFLGQELHERTVGVVGLGRIGREIAAIGRNGFNMNVLYVDPHRDPVLEKTIGAKHVRLQELLKKSDVVIVAVPLLPSTHHLIGTKEFRLMKRTAILVNIGRGPVINEKALVVALRQKRIWAAGIDVFEHEPQMTPGLAKLQNVIVTPHTASATFLARKTMGEQVAHNILCALTGKGTMHRVC